MATRPRGGPISRSRRRRQQKISGKTTLLNSDQSPARKALLQPGAGRNHGADTGQRESQT